jgi:hypothetical protein
MPMLVVSAVPSSTVVMLAVSYVAVSVRHAAVERQSALQATI